MQVNETKREGLSREYTVTVPAQDLEPRVATRPSELSQTARIDGFRSGKVPAALLRKRYGQAVRGAALDRKSTRPNSSHKCTPRMPSSACNKKKQRTKMSHRFWKRK